MRTIAFALLFAFACSVALATEVLIEATKTNLRTGDLAEMRENRMVRALVTFNKTGFFLDHGTPRGFEYELLEEYEKYLNKGVTKEDERIRVFVIPLPFKDLGRALLDGQGDLVAAGTTVTPFRQEHVDFSIPYLKDIDEVVVSHSSVSGINSIKDLSGLKVNVLTGSSYSRRLAELNVQFEQEDLVPVEIVEPGAYLQTEDILEMVNAGIIKLAIADSHLADAWAKVLPNIRVHRDIRIHSGGKIAWAVRKENPELLESLDTFLRQHRKGTLLGNIFFKRYFQNTKWVGNPLAESERNKLQKLFEVFARYSEEHGFDWTAIAAQGYQESGLDQNVRSTAGAIGIMQLLPSTAADPNVGIPDITTIENNIKAGVTYMSFLRDRYFSDPAITPEDQVYFSFAAYNAGPARVRQLREKASEMGLDPNRWFNNVERAAMVVVGRETVRYVANIYKYYIAYRLVSEQMMERERERAEARGD